jgi:hypothetical protein
MDKLRAQLITPALGKPKHALLRGLVSWWPLEESTGADRLDYHGSNDLTDAGTAKVAKKAGRVNYGGEFTPATTGRWLIRGNPPTLMPGDIDFTLACWAKIYTKVAYTLVGKWWPNAGNNREYRLYYSAAADRFRFSVSNDGAAVAEATADSLGAPDTNTWYFICGWHDAVNHKIGISVNAGAADLVNHATGVAVKDCYFGIGGYDGGGWLDGMVDEVAFWKRILTDGERTWLYNGGSGRTYSDINP